ncbi:neuronal acetylcholine receptor subunit beta-2-like [Pecten maximus]|uniref:neuronal acetylcholine receptor subunit beta-2-like n=1 Tax=Pecten maximus TaxID=6579 RepID=UPI0014587A2F|nr:neuronal acetylcholine receptor subunit beta-2-like [Pecten maximus]
MATTAYLYLTWEDAYITWSPASYHGISRLYIPQVDIWRPDIALTNGYSKMKELGDDFILTAISNNGTVEWFPYEVFQTKCSIDVSNFPFDKQTCNVTFSVWTSLQEDIVLGFDTGRNAVNLASYQINSEWDLIDTAADTRASFTDGDVVSFSLTIRRRPEYYMYNVVAPVMLLSFLAVFTFALPVECGEKIGFCMTVYLAFAVFLTIVGESLPASSTQSLLGKYLFALLMMGTAIVMVTTFELRINSWNTSLFKIPVFLKALVHISWRIQCRRRHIVSDQDRVSEQNKISDRGQEPEKQDMPDGQQHDVSLSCKEKQRTNCNLHKFGSEDTTWQDVNSAIDFFCFWIFLTTNIITTCAIFSVAITNV